MSKGKINKLLTIIQLGIDKVEINSDDIAKHMDCSHKTARRYMKDIVDASKNVSFLGAELIDCSRGCDRFQMYIRVWTKG